MNCWKLHLGGSTIGGSTGINCRDLCMNRVFLTDIKQQLILYVYWLEVELPCFVWLLYHGRSEMAALPFCCVFWCGQLAPLDQNCGKTGGVTIKHLLSPSTDCG